MTIGPGIGSTRAASSRPGGEWPVGSLSPLTAANHNSGSIPDTSTPQQDRPALVRVLSPVAEASPTPQWCCGLRSSHNS